ncbi:MAG: UDP-N-acetylmuramoyl-tripeptide--D-alanyl-D-alanine ligase [Planctomycetota bacterium]|nr:MAG: UDP-N-acetylmuramoyl-tripeptide--D-alanyl-D-alanine ligase [Planctomycetota bacterium]
MSDRRKRTARFRRCGVCDRGGGRVGASGGERKRTLIKLTFSEVVRATEGRLASPPAPGNVCGVSTDSRTIGAGELFFALSGPNFDGHDFVADALKRGAAGAVIASGRRREVAQRAALNGDAGGKLIEVDDVCAALGKLAAYHRRQMSLNVIAVVGSNGKTTTKEMIAHVLGGKHRGKASPKSYNNAVGVPLTLLTAEGADDFLVVEIGTNAPGEVAQLAALARPNMAVVTCIAEEHLEGLGDLEGVVSEELSVLDHLGAGGFAAVNIDAPLTRDRLPSEGPTLATFGRCDEADLRVTSAVFRDPWLTFRINGRFEYRMRLPGTHNALNAAGAVAIARRLGLAHEEIASSLESFVPPPMRTQVQRFGGVTLINDAYNANPQSALAAIDALESMPADGRRIAVFGEMRELGSHAEMLHAAVAERLRSGQVSHVLLVGAAVRYMEAPLRQKADLFAPSVSCCDGVDAASETLAELVRDGDVVLLKASRAVGLEAVVEPLRRRLAAAPVS